MQPFMPASGWGPQRRRAALCITFDNLGEAGYLDRGTWEGPVGQHFTAPFIPKLAAALGDTPATYFIEASNVALYPDAIRAWRDAGQEVGLHAWRHESWGRTPADQRRMLLERSMEAMATLGIVPVGFRPPGGTVAAESWAEFRAMGLRYCSGFGAPGLTRIDGVMSLPFAWEHVDAFVLEETAYPLRVAFGAPEQAYDLDYWTAVLDRTVAEVLAEGGQRTIIFHPEFIGASEAKLAVLRRLIDQVRARDIWVASARDVAAFAASEMPVQALAA